MSKDGHDDGGEWKLKDITFHGRALDKSTASGSALLDPRNNLHLSREVATTGNELQCVSLIDNFAGHGDGGVWSWGMDER